MTAALLLVAFAALCLGAATVGQVRRHRRWLLGDLARHRGATEAWAGELAGWFAAGLCRKAAH